MVSGGDVFITRRFIVLLVLLVWTAVLPILFGESFLLSSLLRLRMLFPLVFFFLVFLIFPNIPDLPASSTALLTLLLIL